MIAGVTYHEATGINLICALTGLIGSFLGTYLGELTELHAWVDAIVCGLFIYIALVDVLCHMIDWCKKLAKGTHMNIL